MSLFGHAPSPPARTPMDWAAARVAAAQFPAADPVDVPLTAAIGATLAGDLRALSAVPPFDRAAMDGYAVRGTGPWHLDESAMATAVLDDGTAVPVSTGTALPAGTSGVLRTERALRDGRTVHGPDVTALDLRRCGEEAAAGDRLLPGGTVVTPYVLALAATTGHDSLRVRPRPRVRILVTGDELLDAGLPREGRIRDALGPMLPDLIRVLGADPELARVPDDAAQFTAALTSRGEDVVVTTGGTAHGLRDHLRPLLASLGARYVVDEIRCRPGHPMLLAVLPDGRPLVGMPGNPFAAVAAALTLLDPLCAALTGRAPRSPLRARLDSDHRAHPTDTRLVPVVLTPKGLQPTGSDGPAMLRGIALADGLAIITPGADAVAGDEIEFLELPR